MGLIVDNFAGGGGASTGIEAALGRSVDYAINHSPEAIAMHVANHPHTQHLIEDVWRVDPTELCAGRPVDLAWFSPDCTHFSRAKGAAPRSKRVRGLAWVVTRWAKAVRPRVICLENVEEFQTWGPLDAEGQPIAKHAGRTFRAFLSKLRSYGYHVEYRSLCAADYGAPTTRRRLFLIARCDGESIAWPTPTHGKGRTPWRTAAEIIDWSIPCPSIFGRKKPLAEATQRRIAEGLKRYVLDSQPYLHGNVASFVAKHYGGVYGQRAQLPLGTITKIDHHALVSATLAKTPGKHDVRGWLIKYYGGSGNTESQQQSLLEPLHTITSKARFGLVMVGGEPHEIVDVSMRMLQPHELFAAQGFPGDYRLDCEHEGRVLSKTAQIALCGNSVSPPVAEAIVRANFQQARAQVA